MNYLIGDIQGCCDPLDDLVALAGFSPSRDHLFVLGDLVNRGPKSLQVLERLRGWGSSVTALLGNHDLHLLAVAHGVRPAHASDTLNAILNAPERDAWIEWLKCRPLAARAGDWLLVHAGVPKSWTADDTLARAAEVEALLKSAALPAFLRQMYGNTPTLWQDDLAGAERYRFTINALTRMRFCRADGSLDFELKESATQAPPGLMPWFEVQGRATAQTPIAFGHWSTLGLVNRPNLLALDTGCVWGGQLTAVRLDGNERKIFQVKCAQALAPL